MSALSALQLRELSARGYKEGRRAQALPALRESGGRGCADDLIASAASRRQGNERWTARRLIVLGPEHDRSMARYRAEMREWWARRRRLGAD